MPALRILQHNLEYWHLPLCSRGIDSSVGAPCLYRFFKQLTSLWDTAKQEVSTYVGEISGSVMAVDVAWNNGA